MKFRHDILALGLLACGFAAQAAGNATANYTVDWQGVQTWRADSAEISVIAFRDAAYPSDDRLPCIELSLPLAGYVPTVRVENAKFVPVSEAERQLLDGTDLPDSVQVSTFISTERSHSRLTVQINPFVKHDGVVKKLASYRLVQSPMVQAAPSAKASELHDYADNSVLRSGKFVKIRVASSGIYRLTYEDLVGMGISNPANVRIFGYGGAMLSQNFSSSKHDDLPEAAIYMSKGADGVFNAGDYILFYAQGPVAWTYSAVSLFKHETNVYADYGYYFVTSDAGTGKKIELDTREQAEPSSTSKPVTTFIDRQVHEVDAVNLIDADKGREGGGREFYGEVFTSTTPQNFSFSFPNIVASSTNNKLRVSAAAASSAESSFYVSVGGTRVTTLNLAKLPSDTYTKAMAATSSWNSYTPASGTVSVNLTYNQTVPSGKAYLNYIEIMAERELKMEGGTLFFRYPFNSAGIYQVAGANANVQVWNITDPLNIFQEKTTLTGTTLQFLESERGVQEFVAIDMGAVSSLPRPTVIGTVANQNLHALSDLDFVIITHPTFQSAANRLAEAHRETDGMTVAVVTAEEVYNEFSSGTPDATAYRWLMKMLYDRANRDESLRQPRYLLLFGDGTFDNRKKLSTSGQNWLLTYQAVNSTVETSAYVTDDYFGFLDDNEGNSDASDKLDIGVGRFCVNSAAEADNVVDKTIRYMQNDSKGIWKNQLCFLGDDGDSATDGTTHMKQADSIADNIGLNNKAFQINKILLDAYPQEVSASGESYPLAKKRLDNLLSSGCLLWNYNGHGGANEITNEGMMDANEARSMTNRNLALWSFGTCSFSKFDAAAVSAGEEAVLNPNGGAIGMFSAARTVFAAQNMTLIKHFCDSLFAKSGGEYVRVGDAVRMAKNSTPSEVNKRSFNYIGDPALRLAYPTPYNIVTDTINGMAVNARDTLRALETVTIFGHIADENGQLINGFNGVLQLTVYDKEAVYPALNNNGHTAGFTFVDRQSTIFSGKVQVTDGNFSVAFMVPKDIRYNYGAGRINYYAYDTETGDEGQGYFENFYIGGASEDFVDENDGPRASVYLNSTSFKSGGQVNENPLFIAYLEDANGINTSGAGIGHDLMLMIDDDIEQYYVLNDAFEADEGNFRKGTVQYQLSDLAAGKHTLTFRAWDVLNNSTTQTLDFEVVSGLNVQLYSVSAYPNPVKTNGTFTITIAHDRPNSLLETAVYFYDISGHLVYQQSADAASVQTISCNVGQMGLPPGMYIYRVWVRETDGEYTIKSNKIIVTGQ